MITTHLVKNSSAFMEHKGSSPYSQDPTQYSRGGRIFLRKKKTVTKENITPV
jgi:hypothetical protein